MCMQPNKLFYDEKEEKYVFSWNKNCSPYKSIIVPCGRCPECKRKWRTQLAQRVRYELTKYPPNKKCFLTLTADDDHIDEVFPNGSLDHAYFQKFMKRLRRKLEYRGFTGKIKYLCAGEYGAKKGRPHFHVILFGWKPNDKDLRYGGKSQKGYKTYESDFLKEIWKAGFVNIGDVDEHTAPYMVKYITKFSEIKSDDFFVNGKKVRKPYLVYPKKILGIEYFLENYKQILNAGYILDSRGRKVGIPKSYLKFCETYGEEIDDGLLYEMYLDYKERVQRLIYEDMKETCYKHNLLDEWTSGITGDIYLRCDNEKYYKYMLEQGKIRREIYSSFKNKNR